MTPTPESIAPTPFGGRRILVTGHTGFKGAWLALWLKELGAKVTGYALPPPTSPSLFAECDLGSAIESHIGDICDVPRLSGVFEAAQPEIVFHLAAQPLVRESYKRPVETFATNVLGTVNLLECVRSCRSVRAVVIVTSDKCYENKEWAYAYRENDPLGGHDPYSASKACTEIATASYTRSFFDPAKIAEHKVSVATARAGNVIGGGDWALDRIVPDCVRALLQGEPIPVRNPSAIRPWQHVLEPLAGYLRLAGRMLGWPGIYEGAWNFGPSASANVPVGELVQKVVHHWGSGSWMDLSEGGASKRQPHEATFLKLDCTKANNLLGWLPKYSIDDAVSRTVGWYRETRGLAPAAVMERCRAEIHAYQEKR